MKKLEGHYIVIEGHDGTGKSTQVAKSTNYLQNNGYEVVQIEEPGSEDPELSTPMADSLRELIKNGSIERNPETNLLLFTAARHELYHNKILPALGRGAIVIASRSYISTLAYQGYGEGLDSSHILQLTADFTGNRYMKPDLVVMLSMINHSEREARINSRGALKQADTFESKDVGFQNTVNQAYLAIARENKYPIVDASDSIEEVHAKITSLIENTIPKPSTSTG